MGFHDESGISDRPTVRKTWAPKGKTPIIATTGSWKSLSLSAAIICTPKGNNPKMFLRVLSKSVKKEDVINYLKALKKHYRKKKLLLFWDGLSAHKAKLVQEFLKTQKDWLRVERLPSYAPEINPPEYLWSAMKNKYLCNLRPEGLLTLQKTVKKSKQKISRNGKLLKGFLKASGLF